MPNATRQVQSLKMPSVGDGSSESASARQYPGETAGRYLVERLNQLSPTSAEGTALTGGLFFLGQYEEAEAKGDRVARDRLLRRETVRSPKFLFALLYSTAGEVGVKTRKRVVHGIHEKGLVIEPSTTRGKDAFALLSLGAKGQLNRVRKCGHCKRFLYARFNHQWFCSKKCQWDHYHTPEWRKENRELNRRDQGRSRERLFGKKRFEPLGDLRKKAKVSDSPRGYQMTGGYGKCPARTRRAEIVSRLDLSRRLGV